MNKILILLFIIPTILIAIWFREGNILGTGESGLPFYDLNLQFKINKDAWANYTLGHPTNISIAAKPTYLLLAKLQNLKIPNFLIQAFFLWFALIIAGVSIFFLCRELFPKPGARFYLLASLFYWFNPFSLVNVWHRFLNNFIFFYACLPLLLLFFIKGIKTKKYIYAVLIGLVSLIFSYAFTSIAFTLILWLIFLYTTVFYLVFNGELNRFFIIKFFVLSIIFWTLCNFWWIGQVFSYVGEGSFTAVSSSSFNTNNNYPTFYILSQILGKLTDILRLEHATFFENEQNIDWFGIYQFPLIIILEFVVVGLFILPIIIKRESKETLFLGGLFFLGVFFAKGNSPPLGEIFDKAFLSFSFLQIFRNPFEKMGFILPLPAAPLLSFGVYLITVKLKARWKLILYFALLFWLLLVWGGPFWSNLVFTSTEIPTNKLNVGYQVDVPQFYQLASKWLLSQDNDFRLVIFPSGGEGITYSWPKGYSGVELSNQIFPVTSVSFNTNIPFYNEVSKDLERIFLTRENFPKIMDVVNAKYLVVRSDIDWKIRGMRDPQFIQNRLAELSSSGKFKKVAQFGNLTFWQNPDWTDKTVYPVNHLVKVAGEPMIEDILNTAGDNDSVLYTGSNDLVDDEKMVQMIRPSAKFGLGSGRITSSVDLSDGLMFPTVRILPQEFIYPAILLKEKIEMDLIKDQNTLILKKLSLLGKRLQEAQLESNKNQLEGTQKALELYREQLKDLLPGLSPASKLNGDFFLLQEDIYKIFIRHFDRLAKIRDSFPVEKREEISNLEKTLKKDLIDWRIIPYFGYPEKSDFPVKGRMVYQFKVEKDGNFELLLDSKSWNKYFKVSLDDPFKFQVDQDIVLRKGQLKNGLVSYGFFNFAAGTHEIAWNTPDEINLVNAPSELSLEVEHGEKKESFPINNFDPYSAYVLSLNFRIKKGSGVEAIIEQNNDSTKKGKLEPRYGKLLGPDNYDFEMKSFSAYFLPSNAANSANLILRVKLWNNCEDIYRNEGKVKCLNEAFRRPYDKTTEVFLNNISVVKTMTEIPILRNQTGNSNEHLPKINFTKLNSSEYQVKVEEAEAPFILVLSQLFDPVWKIYANGHEIGKKHFLANAYANGWIIDKKGSYELFVRFIPQDLLFKGEIISLIAVMVGLLLVSWNIKKHYEKN